MRTCGIYDQWVCDFETTAHDDTKTFVWGYGCSCIGDPEQVIVGNTMEDFMKWLQHQQKVYFHNLAFDGAFIMDWLFRNGFIYSDERIEKSFRIIKADTNALYLINITWKVNSDKNFVETDIQDSFKKIPFSVSNIAKAWGLPISKLEIDYTQVREYGHELTPDEIDYIKNDVKIVAYALKSLMVDGFTRMTIGADAMSYFVGTKGGKETLKKLMPQIPLHQDSYFRQAYRGGFTYCNPDFQGKIIGDGVVFDVNSLYPSRMYFCPMPFGKPCHYQGRYKKDKLYPLFICHVRMCFKLKDKHIPCIQLKNNPSFVGTEYLKSSNGEMIDLWLCSVDYDLIMAHYDIEAIEYIDGFKFKSCTGAFKEYIDHFMKIKVTEKGAKKTEAKLFLNNLYGKLATNPIRQSKCAYFDEKDDVVKYKINKSEVGDTAYIPMAVFITAEARHLTITSAQKVYDRFIYADTDSLHLTGKDIPDFLEVDDNELGKWAHEATFTKAKFLRAKTYMEEINGEIKVTCAGMPSNIHKDVTWDNFDRGTTYKGKLLAKVVPGGIVLKQTTFKIK